MQLEFDNRFIKSLPGDPVTDNYPRQVYEACYSKVIPKTTSNPELVIYSKEMAATLGLTPEDCHSDKFTKVFSGNTLLPGMEPYACCYGGHQFGNWAGQLGDGRAINLGEIMHNNQYWTLQLKGAGKTPYSRSADGLAVLRSSIREFLCSEAMYHLGIPTTRALSLTLTGDLVERDMFYNGHPKLEPGAVVCRVAPSFTRFGNFEIFAARDDFTRLQLLVDYTIRNDFPHLGEPSIETYITWFREVCERTAKLMAEWMRVGFVHGVMNTDNMSILGLTIDYGPYGWQDVYDLNWTPNTTDAQGKRYRFGHQPYMGQWNLVQLANAIYPLIKDDQPLKEAINQYPVWYQHTMQDIMRKKLGLQSFNKETDDKLIEDLLKILAMTETDMTLFYRELTDITLNQEIANTMEDKALLVALEEAYYNIEVLEDADYQKNMGDWLRRYIQRVNIDTLDADARQKMMHSVNPKYILRNYLSQEAIDLAEKEGNFKRIHELLDVMRHPYDEQPEKQQFARKRPDWAREKAGCSMLSCSS